MPTGPRPGVMLERPLEVAPAGAISTSRLVLRPLRLGDRAAFIAALRADRCYFADYPLHRPGERDDELFERQVAMAAEGDARGTAWRRAGFLDDGSLAGCFHVTTITRGLEHEGVVSWWVSPACAGRGLASEGAGALAEHALLELPRGLGLSRLLAHVRPGHAKGAGVTARAGFSPTGQRTQVLVAGEWITHDEWARRA